MEMKTITVELIGDLSECAMEAIGAGMSLFEIADAANVNGNADVTIRGPEDKVNGLLYHWGYAADGDALGYNDGTDGKWSPIQAKQ